MPDHDENPGVTPEPTDRRLDQPPRTAPAGDDDREDRERLKKSLEAEREAKRKLEKQLKDLERWKREADEAEEAKKAGELSEVEKLRKTASDTAHKLRELEQQSAADRQALVATRLDVEIERQALAMGYQYPALVPNLVDRSRIVVDPDTNQADPKDIKDALDKLAKKCPGLIDSRADRGTPPREGPRRGSNGQPQNYAPRHASAASVGDELEGFIGGY